MQTEQSMTKVLLDTDILSYFLKGDTKVLSNVSKYLTNYDEINTSIITYYEILSGLLAKQAFSQINKFESFSSLINIIPLSKIFS